MRIPALRIIVKAATVTLLLVTVVWAGGVITHSPNAREACLSKEDVLRFQADSRNGISLTCTGELRTRNTGERSAS